jgi:hypothetical protein
MKTVLTKEQVMVALKKVFSYLVIAGALIAGFGIGRFTQSYPPAKETNPYQAIHSIKKVSIAVNESNELMLIDRSTGKYQIYSDSIGVAIFKMYSNRIYQNASSNE